MQPPQQEFNTNTIGEIPSTISASLTSNYEYQANYTDDTNQYQSNAYQQQSVDNTVAYDSGNYSDIHQQQQMYQPMVTNAAVAPANDQSMYASGYGNDEVGFSKNNVILLYSN